MLAVRAFDVKKGLFQKQQVGEINQDQTEASHAPYEFHYRQSAVAEQIVPAFKNIILRITTCVNQESTFLKAMETFERFVVVCFHEPSISELDKNDDII